jgi:hypothetical protein
MRSRANFIPHCSTNVLRLYQLPSSFSFEAEASFGSFTAGYARPCLCKRETQKRLLLKKNSLRVIYFSGSLYVYLWFTKFDQGEKFSVRAAGDARRSVVQFGRVAKDSLSEQSSWYCGIVHCAFIRMYIDVWILFIYIYWSMPSPGFWLWGVRTQLTTNKRDKHTELRWKNWSMWKPHLTYQMILHKPQFNFWQENVYLQGIFKTRTLACAWWLIKHYQYPSKIKPPHSTYHHKFCIDTIIVKQCLIRKLFILFCGYSMLFFIK